MRPLISGQRWVSPPTDAVVEHLVEALVAAVEEGARLRADDLEHGLEAVHKPSGQAQL